MLFKNQQPEVQRGTVSEATGIFVPSLLLFPPRSFL